MDRWASRGMRTVPCPGIPPGAEYRMPDTGSHWQQSTSRLECRVFADCRASCRIRKSHLTRMGGPALAYLDLVPPRRCRMKLNIESDNAVEGAHWHVKKRSDPCYGFRQASSQVHSARRFPASPRSSCKSFLSPTISESPASLLQVAVYRHWHDTASVMGTRTRSLHC